MKRLLLSIFAVLAFSFAALSQAPEDVIRWSVSQDDSGALVFTGKIKAGWHIYGLGAGDTATTVEISGGGAGAGGAAAGVRADGEPYEISKSVDFQGEPVFFGKMVFGQRIAVEMPGQAGHDGSGPVGEGMAAESGPVVVRGTVTCQACNDRMCTPPIDWDFEIEVSRQKVAKMSATPGSEQGLPTKMAENDGMNSSAIADPEAEVPDQVGNDGAEEAGGLWALIIEAILWGLAMLLTPCVFPMVPMTVSFFIKGESSAAAGRFKALMYGLFIVLLYTVPISIIIILTRAIGGDAVTADIFNWLATHWLPNLIFFVVFMAFAASFFGLFEITLPSKWVNGSDSKAGKGSLGGIFFLALTLVLVSFSCTGPIVGTVLIKSTAGEFWAPMITMLAFSLAFALPFTLLAMFPGMLKKLPKSGGWLNSVKVCLGFIEIALGLKFLSVADQTYHWGILGRKLYLIIWIVCFTLMGLYLLGLIRFRYDEKLKKLSLTRIGLSLVTFAFTGYLVSGLFGAPLKALSGYLPPPEIKTAASEDAPANNYGLTMPLGLPGYFNLDEGLEASKRTGKPVFVDITGHGCVNCREMEQRVWSDPRVFEILRDKYILVALYTDDKTPLPEREWVTTESGKVLKDLGRANSYLARRRFGVNAQPNYVLLDSDGAQLAPVRGYNLDIEDFLEFLGKGLE